MPSSFRQTSQYIEPNFDKTATQNMGPSKLDLSACGNPMSAGKFSIIDKWETGFIAKVRVRTGENLNCQTNKFN